MTTLSFLDVVHSNAVGVVASWIVWISRLIQSFPFVRVVLLPKYVIRNVTVRAPNGGEVKSITNQRSNSANDHAPEKLPRVVPEVQPPR